MFLQESKLLLVLAKDILQARSQIVDVLQRTVTDHEDFLGTVITGNNEECLGGVEDVIHGLIQLDIANLCLQQDRIYSCRSHQFTCKKFIDQITFCFTHGRGLIHRCGRH